MDSRFIKMAYAYGAMRAYEDAGVCLPDDFVKDAAWKDIVEKLRQAKEFAYNRIYTPVALALAKTNYTPSPIGAWDAYDKPNIAYETTRALLDSALSHVKKFEPSALKRLETTMRYLTTASDPFARFRWSASTAIRDAARAATNKIVEYTPILSGAAAGMLTKKVGVL